MKNEYDFIFRSIPVLEENLQKEFLAKTRINHYKKGDVLVKYGEYLKTINLVITGNVRVYIEEDGKEILMYYLQNVETCPLSLSASFDYLESPVSANVVSESATVLSIPIEVAKEWCKSYPSWSIYAIKVFRINYLHLIENYSDFVFMKIKNRVVKYIEKSTANQKSCELKISHQFLARELGTSREVISRILKKLESENVLTLGQQSIKIIK